MGTQVGGTGVGAALGMDAHRPSCCSTPYTMMAVQVLSNLEFMTDDELRKAFNKLGPDAYGTISKAAFVAVYRQLEHFGHEESDAEVDHLLGQCKAAARADRLTFDEYSILMLRVLQR